MSTETFPACSGADRHSNRMVSVHARYDVVVVGGGAAGIATAASLSRRRPELSMAIIEPCETASSIQNGTAGFRARARSPNPLVSWSVRTVAPPEYC